MRNSEVLYVRIPPELMVDLDDVAEANNVTRNTMVIVLLSMAIGHVQNGRLQNASLITGM